MASASGTHHGEALRIAARSRERCGRCIGRRSSMIAPADVIAVLNEAGVRFVLMGNYGITGWRGEPRATEDVDILVRTRDHRKAVRAIHEAFPAIASSGLAVVTRFLDPRQAIPADRSDEAESSRCSRSPSGRRSSSRKATVSRTWSSPWPASSRRWCPPNRADEKKYLDAADFISIVENNPPAIRAGPVEASWERESIQAAAPRFMQLVEDVKAGRRLEF